MQRREADLTGRHFVTEEAYADDTNLAARQALWRYREPEVDLFQWVLDVAGLDGGERFVDIGCGNGLYLAALEARGHRGAVHGLDLSEGMVRAASRWPNAAGVGVADAQALPIADASVDVALAAHMLYHVPDQAKAAGELRRIVRPGGVALAVTNSRESMVALDQLLVEAAAAVAGVELPFIGELLSFNLENGDAVLGTAFREVERIDLRGAAVVPDVGVIVGYIASMSSIKVLLPDPSAWDAILDDVEHRATAIVDRDGALRVETLLGCFVCR